MSYVRDKSFRVTWYFRRSSSYTGINAFVRNLFQVQRSITGDKNPGYKQQIAQRSNATTAMSGTFESVDSISNFVDIYRQNVNAPGGTEKIRCSGYITAVQYLPQSDTHVNGTEVPGARNQAMSRALKKIRKEQVSMSGGIFLGEIREAIHMIRHPAESLRKAIKVDYLDKLKKIKRKDPGKWRKAISQTWLEATFGWRPTISDIEDAMEAYQDIIDRSGGTTYRLVRAGSKDEKHVSSASDFFSPISGCYLTGNQKTYDETNVIIRSMVRRKAVSTAVDKARVFGLTPSEFLPTVWELLPWSFLVDYFTNIGDIIENATTDTSDVLWSSLTAVTTRHFQATCIGSEGMSFNNGSPWAFSTSQGYLHYKRKTVSRNVQVVLSTPPIAFELPGSAIKQLNIVALFSQASSIHPQNTHRVRGLPFR